MLSRGIKKNCILGARSLMNPYALYLYALPGVLAIASAFPQKRLVRFLLLVSAAGIYWLVLPNYVDWGYTHPFEPNDGAARSFALLFGGLIGLIVFVLPLHLGSMLLIWLYKKRIKKHPDQ